MYYEQFQSNLFLPHRSGASACAICFGPHNVIYKTKYNKNVIFIVANRPPFEHREALRRINTPVQNIQRDTQILDYATHKTVTQLYTRYAHLNK